MNKILSGVLGIAVCVLCTVPAHAEMTTAKDQGAAKPTLKCPDGTFLDPRNGGECWKCGKDYERTVFYSVDSKQACERPAGLVYSAATFQHHWGCDPDNDEFYDPRKGGECWKCPANRPRRTAYSVDDSRACATKEIVGEKLASASYAHKFKECSGRGFHDPRNGGECWSCPKGYDRTGESVTSSRACSKRVSEDYDPATRVSGTCPAGAFPDPNGRCYSCPASAPLRSIYPVTGPKACASSLKEAFVPEVSNAQDMCRLVVGALGTGVTEAGKVSADIKKVQQALMDAAKPLIDPIRKPLEEKMTAAVNRVVSETKVDDALDDLEQPVKPYVDDGVAFAKNVMDKRSQLQAVLLDPKIMCAGDAKVILKEVQKYLAKMGKNFITVTLSASFKHPEYQPRVVIGITFATNLDTKGGLYFGVGLEMNAPVDPSVASISIGGAFYPGRTLADFGLTPIPELGFSLAKGGAWDEAVKKMPPLNTLALVDSLDIAWDFDIKHLPAFGISKELAHFGPQNTKGIFSASGNVGWGIPIIVYDGT